MSNARRQINRDRGCPPLNIYEEQLKFLIEKGFRQADIAKMFGCSSRTVQRRMKEFGIENVTFTDLNDSELDELALLYVYLHVVYALFRACSVKMDLLYKEKLRVRESLHRVDPSGIEYRLRRSLHRREYCVPYPNALWHIDGYHKLIRWRMVVHGGVDGYSRVLVFLKVSSNNRSETVYLKRF